MKRLVFILLLLMTQGCTTNRFLKESNSRTELRKQMIYEARYTRAVEDTVSAIWGDTHDFLIKGKMIMLKQPRYTDGIVVYEQGVVPYIVSYPRYETVFNIQEAQKINEKEKENEEHIYDYSVKNFQQLHELPVIPALSERKY